ncbi:TonB-dependent receptor [Fulvivirgaceae bacterium BMA10]|uniref:TonB-dependent receptor n=1 Tax=Splendidivirga corallicola TaxID=3051826 RepID=A0ABT8KQK4_9BACT|nr:TonB-dependent receptor [Fulvivirgaceae bacterium BMA10]
MKARLLLSLMLVFTLCMSNALAQQRSVSGTVTTSEDDSSLPGVTVIEKGTTNGTITDADGNYSLTISSNDAVLVFSFVGFATVEEAVGSRSRVDISMNADLQTLSEVVVVGYGTQSKALLTDNVANIESSQISGISTPGFQNTLVGKAPGVQITQINGKVEGSVKVIIRGLSSISASQEPLYVIDGIEMNNSNESSIGANLNPLLSINPDDIESIDILKDASAAAIYGAKATNGVILITTKKGQQGKATVSVNLSNGIGKPTNLRDWLNREQYLELIRESAFNSGFFADQAASDAWVDTRLQRYQGDEDYNNVDTDWQDEALQSSHIRDASISISGGNEKTTTYISGAYQDNKGIVRGNNLERFSARANIDNKVGERFNVGINFNFSHTQIDRIAGDNAFVTPFQAIAQVPTSPTHLADGEPNGGTLYANFLLQDKHSFRETIVRRTLGKVYGEYEFLPELRYRTELGFDLYAQSVDRNTGRLAPFQSTNGQSFASNVERQLISTNNYFTFDKNIGETGNLNAVAGMTYTKSDRRSADVTGDGFPTDDFKSVSSAATISAGNGDFTAWSQLSYFIRATYVHLNKYILKASFRRDGSSVFGEDFRFGNFPAVSAAWRISEESFLNGSNVLSDLKLRASWGINGNTPTSNFGSLALYGGVSYNGGSGLASTQGANPNLKWEETSQINIGVDFGFMDNRITGSLDYYIKDTEDLIFNQRVPFEAAIPGHSILKNIGSLENKGFELTLSTVNIQTPDFNWKTTLNISTNKNEITKLPNGDDQITARNILREGESINSFYLVEYAGVDPDNGDALFVVNSENADGTLDKSTTNDFSQANRIIVGSPIPDWIGGLSSTLTYKEIDFSFTFQGQWGASVYNGGGTFQETGFGNGLDNQTTKILNRWQQPGDITDVPQARLFRNNGHSHSTRYLQKSDFIRLRNVSLGYSLPTSLLEKLNMTRVRVYFSGLNLLTFTDYDGYDPEATNDDGNTNTNIGSEFYSAPPAKVYTFGLNLTF